MGSQPETAPGSPAKKKQAEKTPGNPLTGAQGWNWAVTGVEPGTQKKKENSKKGQRICNLCKKIPCLSRPEHPPTLPIFLPFCISVPKCFIRPVFGQIDSPWTVWGSMVLENCWLAGPSERPNKRSDWKNFWVCSFLEGRRGFKALRWHDLQNRNTVVFWVLCCALHSNCIT